MTHDSLSSPNRSRIAARSALIATATAIAAAAILLAAGSNRFALACVLPFAFIAVLVPAFAANIIKKTKYMTPDARRLTLKEVPSTEFRVPSEEPRDYVFTRNSKLETRNSKLPDIAAILAGLFVGTMAAAASWSALIAVILATGFAILIAGIAALLSLVMRNALSAAVASVLAFASLASPFLIGPLLKYSGPMLRKILLALAYWANPMAISTHAGLGFDFFRIRGGPAVIYDLGVADHVYAYPAWWAVALLHAALGGAALALALWLRARRIRPREAGHAA